MTDRQKTRLQESDGAFAQLGALRDRLATSNSAFETAAQIEREAETFCGKVRTDLKAYRLTLGLNQKEVAERADLSQSAISKLENGSGDLGLKTVFRIAAVLGVNPVVAFASAAQKEAKAHGAVAALASAVQEDLVRQIPDIVQGAVARLSASE